MPMTNKTTSAIDLVERLKQFARDDEFVPSEQRMLNEAADTITRLQAALRQAEENFGYLANWRDDAIGHDIDIGQEPRTFCEDVEMIEDCARRYRDRIRAIRSSVGGE